MVRKTAARTRYYVSMSGIYGLTVYDRFSQTPAFEKGATCKMKTSAAFLLAYQLNKREIK